MKLKSLSTLKMITTPRTSTRTTFMAIGDSFPGPIKINGNYTLDTLYSMQDVMQCNSMPLPTKCCLQRTLVHTPVITF